MKLELETYYLKPLQDKVVSLEARVAALEKSPKKKTTKSKKSAE